MDRLIERLDEIVLVIAITITVMGVMGWGLLVASQIKGVARTVRWHVNLWVAAALFIVWVSIR